MSVAQSSLPAPEVLRDPHAYRALVAAQPEQALVEVRALIPEVVLDIRYATAHNLLGRPLYSEAAAWLRRPVAQALARVQARLRAQQLGLIVYDAYRPYSATVALYEAIGDEDYAAPPWRGSVHNRGCAVDVGLVDARTHRPVPLPTDFDDLTAAACSTYEPVSATVRHNRALLLHTMAAEGFQNYPGEWWHFNFHGWAAFGLLDLPFKLL